MIPQHVRDNQQTYLTLRHLAFLSSHFLVYHPHHATDTLFMDTRLHTAATNTITGTRYAFAPSRIPLLCNEPPFPFIHLMLCFSSPTFPHVRTHTRVVRFTSGCVWFGLLSPRFSSSFLFFLLVLLVFVPYAFAIAEP